MFKRIMVLFRNSNIVFILNMNMNMNFYEFDITEVFLPKKKKIECLPIVMIHNNI